jgi:serine/threonine-protein kinase PknG
VRPGVLLHSQAAPRRPGRGQYEVAGCLAHGGLGWIYLARDKNVSDRWVVLKGLLNSGDADALAAAIAEQRFLAQVEHPLIVEIYNFVTHEDAGYIVMEYVGGRSLKQVLKERMRANSGAYDPLPVDQALAYILEILPAFQYLHDLGLVYCDFKPDNLIQVGDALKLIDLGGVRHVDDQESAIYGTVGYQAPEVAVAGPSVASDIYTIGRTLVVLCMEFKGYQSTYLSSLPDPESTPLFRDNDSLYCLVAKCCATDPADRFQSADELRVQLLGVLREVVAKKRAGYGDHVGGLPALRDPGRHDRGAGLGPAARPPRRHVRHQHAWLTSLAPVAATKRLEQLQKAPEETAEVRLWRAEAALEADDTQLAIDQSPRCSRPTRGSGGRCGSPASPPSSSRGGTTRPRPSTLSTSRSPASWRPSWPWHWPARRATAPRWPRASTTRAPRPTRRTSPPRRSGWPASARTAATPTGPSRPSTWCRRPAAGTASRASCGPRCCCAARATT